jgi:hypothetical protein
MIDKDKELEYRKLFASFVKAKNDYERDLVRKKISKFSKKYPDVADEIQSRRWTAYGS